MKYVAMRQVSARLACLSSGVFAFSLFISTAMSSITLALTLLFWLLSADFAQKWTVVKSNPVAVAALAFFALSLLGLTYGVIDGGSLVDTFHILLIPIFISLLQEEKIRRYSLRAFLASLTFVLVVSYLYWFDLLPPLGLWKGSPANPTPFVPHITHSLFMAFGAFIFASLAVSPNSNRRLTTRVVLGAIAGLMSFNVLFMVYGKTGQVVLIALLLLFFWNLFRSRFIPVGVGVGVAVVVVAAIVAIAFNSESSLNRRFTSAIQGGASFQKQPTADGSVTERMAFALNSLEIIKKNPIVGVGTGGFARAYARQVEGTAFQPTVNPHNEYIMITSQLGICGLLMFLFLLGVQWKKAPLIGEPEMGVIARGLILTFIVASMVTSTIIDHAEGLLFYWMSGLLFAGLASTPPPKRRPSLSDTVGGCR